MQDCATHGCTVVAPPPPLVGVARLAAAHIARTKGPKAAPAVMPFPMMVPCLKEGNAGDAAATLQGLCPDVLSFPSLLLIEDAQMIVNSKLKKAFCRGKQIEGNPLIDLAHALMLAFGKSLDVKRAEQYGGDTTYATVADIKADWAEEKLHPGDLKPALQPLLKELFEGMRGRLAKDKTNAALETQVKAIAKKFK